jgi:hypothetical protein
MSIAILDAIHGPHAHERPKCSRNTVVVEFHQLGGCEIPHPR